MIHDELDIPVGTIRLKQGGGDNGHNGLRAVTASLGTREYRRIRFGIGRPPARMHPAVFVLRDFSAAKRKELPFLLDWARPVHHCTRDSIEAHLTIVFAALAISRWIEHRTGWSIRKFVRTARRYRTIEIQIGPHSIAAADPLTGKLRHALEAINYASRLAL